jgi:hypothetical protein
MTETAEHYNHITDRNTINDTTDTVRQTVEQ